MLAAPGFELDLTQPLPRVVVGHGALDPVISVEWGRRAWELLSEAGADVGCQRVAPHRASIDPALLRELPAWLETTLGLAA